MALRLRLTLITTMVVAVVLAIFGAGVYVLLDRNLRGRVDQRIEQRAADVARALKIGVVGFQFRDFGFDRPDTYIQIVSLDHGVIDRSESLGNATLPVGSSIMAIARGDRPPATYDAIVGHTPLRIRAYPAVDEFNQPAGVVLIAARLDDVLETLRRLRTLMLLAGLAGIALTAALGWRSARTALRPVEEIGATAHQIGITGDLSRRVSSGRTDELGQLANAFNTMLDRLEAAQAALSRTVETQRRFVDDASHELRTPLTIMRGNLELVARDPKMPAAERLAALSDAIDEAERMSRLVDDLLALARVDAGTTMPETDVALGPLVEEVALAAHAVAGDRTLKVEGAQEGLRVRGSEPLLRRLLENLTDNAIKYTAPGGTIGVALARENGIARLSVSDDGVGMSPDERAHAFDRFWRSDMSRERPGAGLGLSIAKAVVEAHGGTIDVVSEQGDGTTFTVRLPVVREATPTADPPTTATASKER